MTASMFLICYRPSTCALRSPREASLPPAINPINPRGAHWPQRAWPNRRCVSWAENPAVYGVAFTRRRAAQRYAVSLFPIASRPR